LFSSMFQFLFFELFSSQDKEDPNEADASHHGLADGSSALCCCCGNTLQFVRLRTVVRLSRRTSASSISIGYVGSLATRCAINWTCGQVVTTSAVRTAPWFLEKVHSSLIVTNGGNTVGHSQNQQLRNIARCGIRVTAVLIEPNVPVFGGVVEQRSFVAAPRRALRQGNVASHTIRPSAIARTVGVQIGHDAEAGRSVVLVGCKVSPPSVWGNFPAIRGITDSGVIRPGFSAQHERTRDFNIVVHVRQAGGRAIRSSRAHVSRLKSVKR